MEGDSSRLPAYPISMMTPPEKSATGDETTEGLEARSPAECPVGTGCAPVGGHITGALLSTLGRVLAACAGGGDAGVRAELLRDIALFTTFGEALAGPHGVIWRDSTGETAA